MKFIVLICDGAADYSLPEFGGKTPLEVASTPNMDYIARRGRVGLLKTLFEGLPYGSDVANLGILGYDPRKYYTGRGALEAGAMGIELQENEVAFRCNLITIKNGKIHDYSAGHISSEEAKEIIKLLNEKLNLGKFYAGVSYRNLFVIQSPEAIKLKTTPAHDIVGEEIEKYLISPDCEIARKLNNLMLSSRNILKDRKANMIWLWGQGKKPDLESFEERYKLRGGVISAVDLIKGIAYYANMRIIEVEGATGYYDTNYEGKANEAIKALETLDFVYIHVEAPDEAGHEGNIEMKIKAIENIDQKILGKILDSGVEASIAVLPDHATPIKARTHTPEPVPFAIYHPEKKGDSVKSFSEAEAKQGSFGIRESVEFMGLLLS
ncbi:MAG: cofactor-independent phosphoglycerate mutase [Candidatus Hydrothermarchaeota archaeon]|nr:MAG: cofactor-independent phosphoglycerate mutase [Candidatus Hydrothermarchaeota archaeon]